MTSPTIRRFGDLAAPLAVVALAVGAGACASVDMPDELPGPTTSTTAAAAPPAEQPDCGEPTASLRPSGPATSTVPADTTMAEIRERGFLRVGVDVATLRFSAVDPQTRDIDGFDVDIAREVAAALFDVPADQADERLELVGIPSSERIPALTSDRVDMVADVFTINCERREEISFSSEYYTAGQKVLVRTDDPAESAADLGGRSVCVSAGSTAIGNLEALGVEPAIEIVQKPQRADCLVALQQGEVDAMATDDAILAGMAAQDPNLHIVGDAFSTEHYGLGLPLDDTAWVRYVNAVLDDVRTSGRWVELYDRWLADVLGDNPGPPAATYED